MRSFFFQQVFFRFGLFQCDFVLVLFLPCRRLTLYQPVQGFSISSELRFVRLFWPDRSGSAPDRRVSHLEVRFFALPAHQ